MFKVVRDHPKVLWTIIILIILVSILSVYEKQKYKANPYENQIGNPPREDKVFNDTYYYEKLSDNEKKAYEKIKEAIINFKGGELYFDNPLNGTEYSRVTQALYCGEDDLFYAMVNVPMTEKNQSISSITKNITDIKEKKIVKAVDDINFTINKGQILGIVGESGCGKSTLGRCILRLMPISGGKIYFKGTDISTLNDKQLKPYREKMQMVFQNPYSSFNPTMTIRQSFFEIGKVFGIGNEETEKRCKELMENVRLPEDLINRHPNELSGGQLQRLAIARALLLKPDFIMADEAVSALDVSVQAQILNLLLDLRESLGLTMMFISHELTVVEHVCDEIVVMYLGTVVEKAPTKELFSNILHPYTQALISAKPKEHPAQETHRIMLEGEAKSAMDMGEGCKFAPRCRFCQKGLCDAKTPKLREIRPGHFVACHRVESEEK